MRQLPWMFGECVCVCAGMWDRHWTMIEMSKGVLISSLLLWFPYFRIQKTPLLSLLVTISSHCWMGPNPSPWWADFTTVSFLVSRQECEEWPVRCLALSHPALICPFLGIPNSNSTFIFLFFTLSFFLPVNCFTFPSYSSPLSSCPFFFPFSSSPLFSVSSAL